MSFMTVSFAQHKDPSYCPANDGKHKRLAYERAGTKEFNRDDRTFTGKVIHTITFGLVGRKKNTGIECYKSR